MADQPDHRAEEARFLADMPAALGDKAMTALKRIRDVLGLDYAGVDFGLGRDGDLLLFEANATMVIAVPDADERWAYRRTAIEPHHRGGRCHDHGALAGRRLTATAVARRCSAVKELQFCCMPMLRCDWSARDISFGEIMAIQIFSFLLCAVV